MSHNKIKCWVCESDHITEINLVNDQKKNNCFVKNAILFLII